MTRAANPDRAERLLRALGDELRRARRQRKLTRQDLLSLLGLDLAAQTLATYETGTRPLTVVRLVELAEVLGVSPLALLERTLRRVSRVEPRVASTPVDLGAVIRDRTPALAPLRRWACSWLRSVPDRTDTVVRLEPAGVRALAELCEVDPSDLAQLLGVLASAGDASP